MKAEKATRERTAEINNIHDLPESGSQGRKLSKNERLERIAWHREELRKLQSIPRDGWHAGFEAVLRIEIHPYDDRVSLETERILDEEPPRADYLVLVKDKDITLEKEIFKIFRSINIIEYKNLHDSLNIRVPYKICGYAHLLIGTAEHEGGHSS